MTTTVPNPERLAAWLSLLEELPLPVPQEQRDAIRRALDDSHRSIRDIADLLQDCPTLALAILREANRAESARDNPAESLEVALNRLGLARVTQLLEHLPSQPEAQMPRALSQLLLISHHAMQQASGLFANRLARLWQEIHWGSLFALAPLWALATARPDLLETWQRQVCGLGRSSSDVEQELLGMRLLPLCRALAERWRLPEWIGQGFTLLNDDRRLLVRALHVAHTEPEPLGQQRRLDADPELARWLTRPANTILLANSLAMAAHQSWGGPHMLRWQRLTALYLQMPLAELQQQVHGLAAQSARRHARPQLWHPAQALLWPWGSQRWLGVPAASAPTPPDTLGEWRQHCARLLQNPSPFGNAMQLLDTASAALQAGGLQRGLILLADRGQAWLQTRHHFGLPEQAGELKLEVAASALLRKLMQQPAQLRLSPANMADFSAVLPGALKALLPSEHLLLRSLGNGSRVIMLLAADRNGQPLGDLHAQAFGRTAQCIEQAVRQMSRSAS
nr:HDOD domain-containing protein [uncultured Pseudomonas sp.]